MELLAYIYDSPLGNHSNGGISALHTKVCIVNVDGPLKPNHDAPGVRLIQRHTGNLACVPLGLEDKHTMFGGAYVCTSDSRFTSYLVTSIRFPSPCTIASNEYRKRWM